MTLDNVVLLLKITSDSALNTKPPTKNLSGPPR